MSFVSFIPYEGSMDSSKKKIYKSNFVDGYGTMYQIFRKLSHPSMQDKMLELSKFLNFEPGRFYGYPEKKSSMKDFFNFQENEFLDCLLEEIYLSDPWEENDI